MLKRACWSHGQRNDVRYQDVIKGKILGLSEERKNLRQRKATRLLWKKLSLPKTSAPYKKGKRRKLVAENTRLESEIRPRQHSLVTLINALLNCYAVYFFDIRHVLQLKAESNAVILQLCHERICHQNVRHVSIF